MRIIAKSSSWLGCRCWSWVDSSNRGSLAAVQLVDLDKVGGTESVSLSELACSLFDGADGWAAVLQRKQARIQPWWLSGLRRQQCSNTVDSRGPRFESHDILVIMVVDYDLALTKWLLKK